MNEYPKSIRENMVNTGYHRSEDYNLRVVNLPDKNMRLDSYENLKKKVVTALVGVTLAAVAIGGPIAFGNYQVAKMEEASEVVYTEPYASDYTFNMTKSGTGYFTDAEGNRFGAIDLGNGQIDANDIARSIMENQKSK